MNEGRALKRKFSARLSLMAAVATICFSHGASAQVGNPEVYVDMGVLQGLGSAPVQPQQPLKLKPPVPKPANAQGQPQLIAPAPVVKTPAPVPVVQQAAPLPKPVAAPVIEKAYAVSKPPEMPADVVPRAIKTAKPKAEPADLPLASAPPPPPPVAAPTPAPVVAKAPEPIAPAITPEEKPVAPVAQEAKAEEPRAPVVFPVETKVRAETTDPASATASSRPVPVRNGIAGNLNDTVLSRPAPDMDPMAETADSIPVRDLTEEPTEAPAAKREKVATKQPAVVPSRKPQIEKAAELKVAEKKTESKPVAEEPQKPEATPPRGPDNVQKASPELVAELRAREAAKEEEATAPKKAVDLTDPPPPPGPRGKKNMPAVAKAPVDSEQLAEQLIKLPANSDPLLDRLVEKDKQDLVATIESMVAEREDGTPLPAGQKPQRELGSNIVKAEPMQRPYNVYRPKKDEEAKPAVDELVTAKVEEKIVAETAKTEEPPATETKVASAPATEPVKEETPTADVVAPRPPPPGNADEQAYVSVPFSAGLTELDDKITNEIEERLLPVLNRNPRWKVQIHAFASPVKNGTSSARTASLARAMSVRDYLKSKGIEATRMDIRALGAESDRDPMDRVDLIVFDPAKKG